MENWLFNACESIDAGFFSGDTFHNEIMIRNMRKYVGRWTREMDRIERSLKEEPKPIESGESFISDLDIAELDDVFGVRRGQVILRILQKSGVPVIGTLNLKFDPGYDMSARRDHDKRGVLYRWRKR